MAATLYDRLWEDHVVRDYGDGTALLAIDRHLVQEVSSPVAFEALAAAGRGVRRPDLCLAVADHAVPTHGRGGRIADPLARMQVSRLEENCARFGIRYLPLAGPDQGIVHVVGPEQGFTLPGLTLVCGDSHTATHGAFGTLAFGIGASECEIVLATQCLVQRRERTLGVRFDGKPGAHVSAKDVALAVVAALGVQGAAGHAVEYRGALVDGWDMAARMTLCNMSIEAGARIGLIAPDDTCLAWLEDRPLAPRGTDWKRAEAYWGTLRSAPDARFDREVTIDASAIAPRVTWGTTPADSIAIGECVPDPGMIADPARAEQVARAIAYMGLAPGTPIAGVPIDRIFIGSCTNGRIEDLRAAAAVLAGRRIARHVGGIVVPGSTRVKAQAEREGLARIFRDAGLEWRDAGCSMCVAMNDDRLSAGQRCASTSNRNFEGRQGAGARTHLMSPAMAAAAALAGTIADVRAL